MSARDAMDGFKAGLLAASMFHRDRALSSRARAREVAGLGFPEPFGPALAALNDEDAAQDEHDAQAILLLPPPADIAAAAASAAEESEAAAWRVAEELARRARAASRRASGGAEADGGLPPFSEHSGAIRASLKAFAGAAAPCRAVPAPVAAELSRLVASDGFAADADLWDGLAALHRQALSVGGCSPAFLALLDAASSYGPPAGSEARCTRR